MKEVLFDTVTNALKELDGGEVVFTVVPTDNLAHGDYSVNVAMVAAKAVGKNPKSFAEELVAKIAPNLPEGVERVEVAGPGFLNFFLKRNYFSDVLQRILSNKKYGWNKVLHGQKVMVEYTDPNPFKEFHIGHLMSNAIGESVARLFEAQGATVKRACYQGDVGLHVAKAIWGMQSVPQRDDSPLEALPPEGKARYLGHAYKLGSAAYDDGHKEDIEKLNRKIYDRSDGDVNKLYDWGRKISLEYFERIYARLGTTFDFYFFESEAGPIGKALVEAWLSKGVFEKSDGAIVFHAEKYDPSLHTRVFVNSHGLPTYEAKELGLAGMKDNKWHYDKSMVITGNEVNDYFRVLLSAMEQVLPELRKKTEHLSHGMLRLPSGKMSSRTGEVVTAEALLAEIGGMVRDKIRDRDYDDELKDAIVDAVSVGAVKFSILRQAPGSDIIFDIEKSVSFEGDSGPYLQYTATRARSVLDKAKQEGVTSSTTRVPESISLFERLLARFPEVVSRAGEERAPHHVVTYLLELASAFNHFYGNEQIVDAKDEFSPYKIALTTALRQVIGEGLWILGITLPERM